MCLSPCAALASPAPPSAEVVSEQVLSPSLAESLQQPKAEASPLPDSTTSTSPWDSLDDPFLALRPIPARAHSAPLTRPAKPLEPTQNQASGPGPLQAPASQPQSAEAFPSLSWSQSQWIAFNDDFVPVRRQTISGGGLKGFLRPQSNPPSFPLSGRPLRFFSDDPADPCNRVSVGSGVGVEDQSSAPCVQDVCAPPATAPASQNPHGNKKHERSCTCSVCLCEDMVQVWFLIQNNNNLVIVN